MTSTILVQLYARIIAHHIVHCKLDPPVNGCVLMILLISLRMMKRMMNRMMKTREAQLTLEARLSVCSGSSRGE